MTPDTVAALRRQKTRQAEERLKAGELWENTGFVFTTEIGTPLEKGNVLRRSFWPLLAQTGLAERTTQTVKRRRRGKTVKVKVERLRPLVQFHDLRHTAATLLLEQGTHPVVVAAMLGHSKTSTTLNVYPHVVPSIIGAATKAMEDILS